RDFVGEHGCVRGSESRNRRFAGSRNARENVGGAATNGAGRMNQKAALLGKHERMRDAKEGGDRIRVRTLANPTASGPGIPLRAKIASFGIPEIAVTDAESHVV